METILGLDLGTNSVGWALVRTAGEGGAPRIEAGVYVFPEAGDLEGGLFVSDRLKRGQKRRQRIQLRRRRQRLRNLMRALVEHGLLPSDAGERERLMALDREADGRPHNPFTLRKRGLDEQLTLHQLGRCLYHIARRRGYFSTRDLMRRGLDSRLNLGKATGADLTPVRDREQVGEGRRRAEQKEEGLLLARLREVREQIVGGAARTVGEFCAIRIADPGEYPSGVRAGGKRRDGRVQKTDVLGWRADRLLHEEEFEALWAAQAPLRPDVLTRPLHDELWRLMFDQRPLLAKRGLVGTCSLFPSRKRLPRAALLAQRCIVLETLVNLSVRECPGSQARRLTAEEVGALADELDRRDALEWSDARRMLRLPAVARFSEEPSEARKTHGAVRGRRTLVGNRTATAMRAALGRYRWDGFGPDRQENLVDRLLYCRHPRDVAKGLRREFGLTGDEVRAVASALFPEGYTSHCARVWRALEPHLRQGRYYSEACEAAGFRASNTSTVVAPPVVLRRLGGLPDLRSPVVQRAAKMAFRVINAVIDKHGKPDVIRIEMPRDVSRTNKQRQALWEQQDEEARWRERAKRLLVDNGLPETGINVKKVRLWEEWGESSPYEPDVMVTLAQLVNEYEVDHIVPRSRCWDDSWTNLTIASRQVNLEKGDRTPFEWAGDGPRWQEIVQHVKTLRRLRSVKRKRFLCEAWEPTEFVNRALSDTRYLSTVVKAEVAKLGVPVEVSRGQLTAELRRLWELGACLPMTEEQERKYGEWQERGGKRSSKPRFDHRHHALDAIVTALTDVSTLQGMTAWYKAREARQPARMIPKPKPWPTISEDVRRVLAEMQHRVVHAPTRGVEGALNEETARRPPPREVVEAALAALPVERRSLVPKCVVVGTQLVRIAPDGGPLSAYDLGNNHHAVIWERLEPDAIGRRARDMTVVSMMEAARRAAAGAPIFADRRDGWRSVMALCENDIVEVAGDRAGLYRLARCSATGSHVDLTLRPLCDATADDSTKLRLTSRGSLAQLVRRICLSAVGDIVSWEPRDAGG